MYRSAYDLKSFYNSLGGRITRRIIKKHIRNIWPNLDKQRLLGYGYAVPYINDYVDEVERVFAIMPSEQGVHHWPQDGSNMTCVCHDSELAVETNSVDRILLVHSLEFSTSLEPLFQELWRVLKSNGRVLIIVPNRLGLWARATWSPYGHGTPYSISQVETFLRNNMFVHERTFCALYVPPFKNSVFLKSAEFFEKIGRFCMPGMGGVHFFEASKQLYAGIGAAEKRTQKERPITAIPQPTSREILLAEQLYHK